MAGPTGSNSKNLSAKASGSKKASGLKTKKPKEHVDVKLHSSKRNASRSNSKKGPASDSKQNKRSESNKTKDKPAHKIEDENASKNKHVGEQAPASNTKPPTRGNSQKSGKNRDRSGSQKGSKNTKGTKSGKQSPARSNSPTGKNDKDNKSKTGSKLSVTQAEAIRRAPTREARTPGWAAHHRQPSPTEVSVLQTRARRRRVTLLSQRAPVLAQAARSPSTPRLPARPSQSTPHLPARTNQRVATLQAEATPASLRRQLLTATRSNPEVKWVGR